MADRRRTTRYVVPEAAEASLLMMQDVYIERLGSGEIVVLADVAVPAGAELMLEVSGGFEAPRIPAVVAAVSPSRRQGNRHPHRLTLRVPEGESGQLTANIVQPAPSLGVLLRRVPVRVRDISTGGCLLEAINTLPDGSIGVLELTFAGVQHTETLRVCRTSATAGSAWPARTGARFLALSAPPSTSVRNVVARFELLDELGAMPEAMARVHLRGTTAAGPRRAPSWSHAISRDLIQTDDRTVTPRVAAPPALTPAATPDSRLEKPAPAR